MAKLEHSFRGEFDSVLQALERHVLTASSSATLEEKTDKSINGVRCAVRVFERYSMMGGNRVSLSVTLLGDGEDLFVSAIATGGSQAVLFKINTFGEEAFLDTLRDFLAQYGY